MAKGMLRFTMTEPHKLVREDNVPVPTPGPGQVLVKVLRVGVCGSDPTIFRGLHPYAKRPLVMGHEFSGTVEALGAGVTAPAKGVRVTVIPHVVCGKCKPCRTQTYNFCEELKCMGAEDDGAHCEYVNVAANMVLPIPETMTLEDAALVEPACVAYHGTRRASIRKTDQVLIVGAGPIGLFAMQSAKALGAAAVYVADLDPWRLALAEKLGASGIINVGQESLQDGLARLAGGHKEIDVFLDCVGEKGKVMDLILQLARRGTRIVMVGVLQKEYSLPHLPDFVQHELSLFGTTMYVPQDYREMIDLMGRGKIRTAGMITHTFPLSDLPKVFAMIEARQEPFFKIMLTVGA